METQKTPYISVIIPTYNRAHLLAVTLESFLGQNYPKDRYQIIVADNNSADSTSAVVAQYLGNSAVPVSYFFEPRQGVHYARNSAAKMATGDILYFTDDDMVADRELLREIVKPFAIDKKVASVTGRVLPKWEQPPPPWVIELCNNALLSLLDRPEQLVISSADCGVYSCHQALRREVFFQAGGFNPENTAGEWIGDGETGLNLKIGHLGYKFAYIGSSVIYHMIPPSRTTQSYLNKRLQNQGNCDSYTAYREHQYPGVALYGQIFRHLLKLLKSCLLCVCKRLLRKERWRLDRAYVSYFIGRIKYDFRLAGDEGWRQLVLKSDWLEE